MNAQTTPVVVATPADAVAIDGVVTLLDQACQSAKAAHAKAREAAKVADARNFLDLPPVERIAKIIALYLPHLEEGIVKTAFSSAVTLLATDKPVRIAATAKTEETASKKLPDYPEGRISFKAPEVLPPVAPKDETLADGQSITELTASDAVAKLCVKDLQSAAKAARETLGIGRKDGAGRPAAKAAPTRAPFMAELAACLKDDALLIQCFHLIGVAAKNDPRVLAQIRMIAKANEPEVRKGK